VIQLLGLSRPLIRRRTARGWVLAAVLQGFAVTACSLTPPAKTAAQQVPRPSTLILGAPVERTLAGGAKGEYELRLEAGSYLELTVDQSDLDVAVALAGPDGSTLVSVNDPGRRDRAERVVAITPAAGVYRLTIAPASPQSPGGRYRAVLKQLRPAGPADEDRVAAERLFAEGRRLDFQDPQGRMRALDLYKEALAQWQAANDEPGQVRALVELETTEYDLSHSAKAVAWSKQALDLARKIGDQEGQARALFFLGEVQLNEDPRAGLEAYGQSLDLWTRLGNATGQGKSLLGKALAQLKLHQQDEALGSLQQAIPLLRQTDELGKEASALVALQGISMARGEIGDALGYLNRALALSRQAGNLYAEANALYNLANIQKLRGELQRALESLESAFSINDRVGDGVGELSSLYGLGSIYHDLGELDKAREKYEQALALAQTLDAMAAWRGRLLNNIGWILYRQGEGETAQDYFEHALVLSLERKDSDGIAAALHNLGVAEVALGDPGDGLKALRQALELRQGGSPYPWVQTLRELGTAYERLGEPEEAACSFQESLAIGKRIGAPGLIAETLYRWALLDREQGGLQEALAKVKEAISITESVRDRVEADALRTSFFASKRDYYELYVDLLIHLYQQHREDAYQREALAASEQARARGLLDLLAEGKIDLRQGIAPDLKQREKDVSSRLFWFLDQLPRMAQDPAARIPEQLIQFEAEMNRMESEVREQSPRYAELRYPTASDFEGIRRLVDPDSALLEYFVGREGSALFVVTREGLTSYALPPARELLPLIQKVRALIERPSELEIGEFRRQAFKLHQVLLGSAEAVLAGKRSLLIAPDGPLYTFPFEVLLTEETARPYPELPYLLQQHEISYIPSASVLAELRTSDTADQARESAAKAFVAFANPVTGGKQIAPDASRGTAEPEQRSFPPLTYSEAEVKAIAGLFANNEVELYIGEAATKRNALDNPLVERARHVHFATHGFVDEAHPERSALVLTPSAGEDGYLTVAEIFNMRLRANLLVLSACETGRGMEVGGEGIVGLTRAFLYAGAKSLIVSLWPVVDRPTAVLMQTFYRSLGTADNKAAALRQAKLDMIRSGQANPYLWAPFILSGDPH